MFQFLNFALRVSEIFFTFFFPQTLPSDPFIGLMK